MKKVFGFSLIEALVVIGIMVLMALMAIPSLRGRQQSTELKGNARNLLNDLRLAQQLTIGEQVTYLVKIYATAPQQYQLIKRDDGDTVIKTHTLSTGITWQSTGGFTDNEIIFTTTGAVAQAGIVILQNVGGQTISLDIKPSGYVHLY
jgi:type II secretion system protein H